MSPRPGARRGIVLPTLRGYQRAWLGRDILAGLSAGAVVIPQAMAYATIADLPVQVGLYTCMVPMLVYAMLGGSRAMSVSTTSTIATLTATTFVSAGVTASSDDIPRDLITLTLLVGLILLVARLLRLGTLVEIINRPTVVGIQIGVGATVAVGQLPKLLGEEGNPTGQGFVTSLNAVLGDLGSANPATVVLSAASVAVLFLFKRFLPRVPAPLIVVGAGIALAAFGGLRAAGVELIAPVPEGFPVPGLPSLENVGALLPGALSIAVMAFLESAAVARGIRKAGEPPIDSNQELLATSAANIVGSFFSTLPAAGGFSQSAVNQNAGARTQLSSLVTVALAVLVGLFLGPVLSLLPEASLAALVFVAVFGLIDVRAIVLMWRISRRDFWIALVTALIGLSAGLLTAVAAGVVITLVLVLMALSKVRIRVDRASADAIVVRPLGALFTANAQATEQAILAAVEKEAGARIVVLDGTRIEDISVTVIEMFEDLGRELTASGHELRIAHVEPAVEEIALRTDVFQRVRAEGRQFPTVEAALAAPASPSD
ncbi:MFS superfamily sulfate permease-like transporter [Agromyces terreus]|uniref:MFS superfamily sulfate permease-like transporter n=1 Tax=Agromyces terreus TaxID=424795 RepID=A0A9X2GVW9_9MICO|nr:SulP family inorganic anion transporter [Agromyces terreus]MCP2370035.1 MFS superfamily sulfate permease-like transporter [Agromyces terreus]